MSPSEKQDADSDDDGESFVLFGARWRPAGETEREGKRNRECERARKRVNSARKRFLHVGDSFIENLFDSHARANDQPPIQLWKKLARK